jgi:hypothetical protein
MYYTRSFANTAMVMFRNAIKWTIRSSPATSTITRLIQRSYSATKNSTAPAAGTASTTSDRVRLSYIDENKEIVKVELSRPSKLNSLDMPMFEAIASTAKKLQDDPSVRAVILCGEGRAFCTGLDVVRREVLE